MSGKNWIKCGICPPKFPYNLPIPDLVEENTIFLERVIEKIKKGQQVV
jgi:hypothetical protein